MKLVTADQMRAIEAAAFAAGATPDGLMQRAGLLVAQAMRERSGGVRAWRILVLCGPGNNGGDGLVAARHLAEYGATVRVFLLAPRSEDDANLRAVRQHDVEVTQPDAAAAELPEAIARADAILDAMLGTGRRRPLEGLLAAACEALQSRRTPLYALDLPTGLDADSGGVDPLTPAADVTLTLGFSKIGLHVQPGSQYAGEVVLLDIGLAEALADAVQTSLLTPEWARSVLPARPAVSNKGSFGRVLVVAGSASYSGAATLSCLGSLRAGAGLVTLASIASVRAAVAAQLPEVTFLPLPEDEAGPSPQAADVVLRGLDGYDSLLIGPGLSQAPGAQALVRGVLSAPRLAELPVVVDADALNALARLPAWPELLPRRAVLTPHPGEMARLMGSDVSSVQADRPATARAQASAWRTTLVLKGANTVVAQPEGETLISTVATALLATAGTGDVLAGTIAGLMAQELSPFEAAGLGVYLHGAAAATYAEDYGPSGLLAHELGAGIARAAARLRA